MEDWENEEIPPLLSKDPPKNKWDDEDVEDEDDVKESWEDEDEPTQAPAAKPAEKPPKLSSERDFENSRKKEPVKEEPLDPEAEKLCQQSYRLAEEADYTSTKELFVARTDEKNIDTFIPKSENDFLEYAELISLKLHPFEKSFHYIGLLKAVMRLSMNSLKGADAKDIASSLTVIANEKLKAEKEANAGKKKMGGKKKLLNVDKPDEDLLTPPYDALDDYEDM